MTPRSLADAAADLLANPRPLLFVDTCDVVNLLQVLATVAVNELRAVNRLLSALGANPQRCQLAATYVTAIEYLQKTDAANPVYQKDSQIKRLPPDEMTLQLTEIDAQIRRIHLVRQELGVPLPAPIIYSNLDLVSDLRVTAGMLLDCCWELGRDQHCVDAAITRVFAKMRPSHKREVKDSIHFEHCLELANRLRQNGFAESILFCKRKQA